MPMRWHMHAAALAHACRCVGTCMRLRWHMHAAALTVQPRQDGRGECSSPLVPPFCPAMSGVPVHGSRAAPCVAARLPCSCFYGLRPFLPFFVPSCGCRWARGVAHWGQRAEKSLPGSGDIPVTPCACASPCAARRCIRPPYRHAPHCARAPRGARLSPHPR